MVADLYLGYGLAATLAGVTTTQPPEPCALPGLACHIARSQQPRPGAASIGKFQPTWSPAEYRSAIAGSPGRHRPRRRLPGQPRAAPAGAVLGRPTRRSLPRSPRWRRAWAMDMHGDGWSVVSASPELFLRTQGRPGRDDADQGHAPGGGGGAIADSAKDRAEHIMIVDLERNDLGRVCEPGSVHVPIADDRAADGRRAAPGLHRGRHAPPGGRPGRAAASDLPRRVGHRCAQALGDRPHRPARAGRPGRVDGRRSAGLSQRRSRPRPDDPHVRDRRRPRFTCGSAAASCGTPIPRPRSRSRWSRRGRC